MKYVWMCAGMAIVLCSAGCGSASTAAYSEMSAADVSAENESGSAGEEQITWTGTLSLDTAKYDTTVTDLKDLVKEYGGYTDYLSEARDGENGMRSAWYTVRIPTEKTEDFMTEAAKTGTLTSKSLNGENAAKTYNDNSARIRADEKQLERLNTMMDQAETIEDMMAAEDRIAEVETELNQLKRDQESLQEDIDYDVLDIDVTEKVRTVSPGYGQRIKQAFIDGWYGFANALAALGELIARGLPYILCGIVIAAAAIKKIRKDKGKKKDEKH